MAQATNYTSPDLVQKQEDVTMSTSEEPQAAGEKKSVFGRLKDKTKTKTNKLKNKLKPGSGGEAADDSSSSSSDEETDAPENNVFSGMTQPEYERKLESGQLPTTADDDDSLFGKKSGNSGGLTAEEFNTKSPSDFPPSHGQADSALSKQFEGLSTDDKPSSRMDTQSDSTIPSEKSGAETSPDEGLGGKIDRDFATNDDDILSKAGSPAADDSTFEKAKTDPEGLLPSEGEKSAEPAKSWGQWVGEKVGLAKDSSKTKGPSTTTSAADKPITEKAYDSVLGAKDAVVEKTNEATDSAKAKMEQNKDAAATTDPAKQTYTQKLTGAIYGAKYSLMSSTHPGDEDKALSQKVTETVSNLPGTIKSTLGFGGNKAATGAASPTTTPAMGTSDVPSSSPSATAESAATPPQSPGIVSRISDSVSSLWGKKQHTSTTTDSTTSTAGNVDSSGLPTSEATPTTESGTGTL